jgi:hypothetical protein
MDKTGRSGADFKPGFSESSLQSALRGSLLLARGGDGGRPGQAYRVLRHPLTPLANARRISANFFRALKNFFKKVNSTVPGGLRASLALSVFWQKYVKILTHLYVTYN